MIITNDGEFAHHILSPARHVEKTYYAQLSGSVTDEMAARFGAGVTLEDGTRCRPAALSRASADGTRAVVKISEGKYHQIKRMFAVFGLQVLYLRRLAVGDLFLPENLPKGECRELTVNEVQLLQKSKLKIVSSHNEKN